MKLSNLDRDKLKLAKQFPAEILVRAARYQAENSLLSEKYCREIAGQWNLAAEKAAKRREESNKKYEKAAILPIFGV